MMAWFKHFHDSLNIVAFLAPGSKFFFAKGAQFPFNLYGMKLKEGYAFSGTVILHFWDQHYKVI